MDLRIVTYDHPISLDQYIGIEDYDNGNELHFKFGKQHQHLLAKMNREDRLKRVELLIKLIVIAFAKKYGIENPYKKLKQVFPLTSEFYNRSYGR